MKNPDPILKLLKRLWTHIEKRRKNQFGLLLVLMIVSSFAEVISIGAVLPFLGALTAPDKVFTHPVAQPFIEVFGITSPNELLLPLTISFGLAAILAGVMRLLLLWSTTRISHSAGVELSLSVYRKNLYQPYSIHVERNSSEVINGITSKASGVIGAILNISILIGASITLISVLGILLMIDPVIAISAFVGFGIIYTIIILLTKNRLLVDSQSIAYESTRVIKALQEGLGGIRDVLIDGSQETFCKVYRDADYPLRRAQGNTTFIAACPRFGMEALGMVLIASLAYTLTLQSDGISKAIPILGTLALGAQRLLPVLQQIYHAWSTILGGQASLQDALNLLDQPLPSYVDQPIAKPCSFHKNIVLSNMSFRYSDKSPWVFNDVNLTIPRGSRIGFIGETGGGKSTLLDIIMGLLQPTGGTLEIDNQVITPTNSRTWQAHLAHVPQAIFLSDNTIEENIAFGIPKEQIDHERVREAAQQAQIADIIESWSTGYQTKVGERGVRLSGGQRQRIGIARALYKKADVIIFDEATSALDSETESAVVEAIDNLNENLTILIIAHRLSTLKNCTEIVELKNGSINKVNLNHIATE